MDPAFEGAGQDAGLQIWRIENFEVVAYPPEKYGQFYQGDSYIVLRTVEDENGRKTWDIHFWLGSETSQDEQGAAAIKCVELDDSLGGVPVQHREVEGHESALFLSHFKKGVRYLKGGVASGFHHVDPDAPYPARLFHVKGRRNVRVKQVECSVSAMNKGDCFLLDAGKTVYCWVGPNSRRMERLKGIMAANGIRDEDHAGGAKIVIIDETSTPSEVEEFYEALGGGSNDDVADEDAAGDDSVFERSDEKVVSLHRIHEDDEGLVQSSLVAEKPLLQSMLDSGDCFLLDTAGSGIYVWVGRGSSKPEKLKAMQMATSYLKQKDYPAWTKVERVVEGGEPTAFKQYFRTWKEPLEQVGLGRVYTQAQIAAAAPEEDFNVSSLHAEKRKLLRKNAGPAFGFMPDDGSGKVEMFRVEDFELQPVDEACNGFFFGGDSYVIKYTYEKDNIEKYILYFWQGLSSTQDERAASAIHTVKMDNELNGKAVQVRVVQGYEPGHLLRIFQGQLVIFLGGKASGFKNVHDHDTYDADGTRLFQVRGTCELDARAEQRQEAAKNLNSDDVFVLETPAKTFIWIGNASSEIEKNLAVTVAERVSPGHEVVTINEGSEEDDFWDALGGKDDYPTARDLDKPLLSPRLFHCTVSPAGFLRVNEVYMYGQDDLNEDDVMVLDSGDEIYIWIGQGADEQEREKSFTMAESYIKTDPTERTLDNTVVVKVKQGEEPNAFKSIFPAWNPDMWQKSINKQKEEENQHQIIPKKSTHTKTESQLQKSGSSQNEKSGNESFKDEHPASSWCCCQ